MPAARFSATRRSSSANMYAGTASRRREGRVSAGLDTSGVPMEGERVCPSRARRSGALQGPHELRRELAAQDGLGGAGQPDAEIVVDLHDQLAAIEPDRDGTR